MPDLKNPKQVLGEQLWLLADLEQANSQRRSFASRAYRKAVWALDQLPPELTADREALLGVPGIGKTIADLVIEFLETGEIPRLERLLRVLPREAARFSRLPRMTPTRLRALKADFAVETVSDFRRVLDEGEVQDLPGVGENTASVWRDRLAESDRDGLSIPRAAGLAERFQTHLESHLPHVAFEVAGGVARLDEWVDAIEFEASDLAEVEKFLAQSALTIDLDVKAGRLFAKTLAGAITIGPPDSRLNLQRAKSGLRDKDLRGDFHLHSDWSPDGRQTFSQILESARALGWQYLAITDHGIGLRFGGLDVDSIRRQRDAIMEIREVNPDLLILHGAELNIDRAGQLDYDDDVLGWLDFRLAGVHSHFGLAQEEQTERLVTAITNPLVHAIAHLTGRRIGTRPPIDLHLDTVFQAAASCATALEVNGHLDRLDVSADNAQLAASAGAIFIVNSDAHRPAEMRNVFNGIKLLQRVGVASGQVVNTWELPRLQNWLDVKSTQPTSTAKRTTSSRS